ncbi:MAG: 6-phospho-beta-glucosidase BglT [Thermotoga sp. 50_1627]|uniref:family 4 glycosyl hydrolase n=1 Tax=Pseudothermotoga sp. TaxID=2033661 RepID=UPI00076C1954|nr:MAG: 6-phospho-beta-glucosidase BglT [Thermotoga sp. 50_64]KUK25245.1 MAG: 6-phospho-beta-glucosidase BglT [Thermotoga sp. 50_1627]MBC7116277.1 6-phospho-beta-glucosidase [Pseudothermotoga sp.]MDK2923285.1 6-phospho-beta-glucosidase [Pseudothermotoga sp.]HBT38699.1 6-phospho-beta-glucosidase [Pseudothermotoga sp.]
MKIAIIGAGSSYTPELISGLLDVSSQIDLQEVWMHDINERKLRIMYGFCQRLVKGRFKLFETKDFVEAVRESNYVVFQFRPGGLKARKLDEEIPIKYGLIGQETTGVGGFAAALRAFPILERYLDSVARHSEAIVINFTNPSGHVTEFVLNYLGFERFIGLCNVPINFLNHLAKLLSCRIEDLFVKYYGLNHLSFVEKVWLNNEDVTERVFQTISQHEDSEFPGWLIASLKLLMNPYLRYYVSTQYMFKKICEEGTRAEKVIQIEDQLFKKYETENEIPQELSQRGGSLYSTAAARLIKDLTLSNNSVHIVNTRNHGAIDNLPGDYVLELACLTKAGKVLPITVNGADPFAVGLIHTIKMYERLTIEAYLRKSKATAIKALLLHPLGPRSHNVRELLEEICQANREYFELL